MKLSKFILTTLCGVSLISASAMAKSEHAEKNKGHKSKQNEKIVKYDDDDKGNRSHAFYKDEDRDFIREHIRNDYYKHCPPGLAKKHNGCLPPGHAKRYKVGYVLPGDIEWRPVPRNVLVLLRPAPAQTKYVVVDEDVLLISLLTKKVIEAIDY